MPILRYFLGVGGVLLALLFICDATLPKLPSSSTVASESERPAVRIRSERKWPERIVLDTNVPMIASVTVAQAEVVPPAAAAADAKARVRDAFAQASAVDAKPQPTVQAATTAPMKIADAIVSKPTELKTKPKHKTAKAQTGRPLMVVAQQPQPHFGWFGSTW